MAEQRTYGSGLIRDVELLEVLTRPEARDGGLGVSRVAELAGRDKAQVSRALATLTEAGIVHRDPTSRAYRPGWRLFSLAARTGEAELAQLGAPFLRRVVTGLNETTHLCVLRGNEVLTLCSQLALHAFRGLGWEGTVVNTYTTSAGRTLMSDWDEQALREWWQLHPPELPATPEPTALPGKPEPRGTITVSTWLARIAEIRERGYATVDEEFEPGLVGVSAPVRGFRGDIVAAINVAAPKERLGAHLERAGEFTRSVADEMSATLR